MPTYKFQCPVCEEVKTLVCRMTELDEAREKMFCLTGFGGHKVKMKLVVQGGGPVFTRSPFPTEAFEHADFNPRVFRDKHHLLDHCEEAGLRSRLLEDGDVP